MANGVILIPDPQDDGDMIKWAGAVGLAITQLQQEMITLNKGVKDIAAYQIKTEARLAAGAVRLENLDRQTGANRAGVSKLETDMAAEKLARAAMQGSQITWPWVRQNLAQPVVIAVIMWALFTLAPALLDAIN